VPLNFQIGVANVINKLRSGVDCTVPAFRSEAPQYPLDIADF